MPTSSTADRTTNILLSLAWMGELDKTQIHRLCLSNRSIQTVENTLRALRADGLVEPRSWYISVNGIPHEQPSLWALTKKGHAQIAEHDQYPPKPAPVGPRRLIGHDHRTNDAIITLVELARPSDLSGIFVQYEVRLDPTQPRPRMDALLVMQTGGGYTRTDLVPWSKDPAIADEARWRFAIESDSATEPIAVIEGKARAYRAVHRDPTWRAWWREQWGPLPFTIWVVPDPPRVDAVHAAWERVWPDGTWMLTDGKEPPQEQMAGLRQPRVLWRHDQRLPPVPAQTRHCGAPTNCRAANICLPCTAPAGTGAAASAAHPRTAAERAGVCPVRASAAPIPLQPADVRPGGPRDGDRGRGGAAASGSVWPAARAP